MLWDQYASLKYIDIQYYYYIIQHSAGVDSKCSLFAAAIMCRRNIRPRLEMHLHCVRFAWHRSI